VAELVHLHRLFKKTLGITPRALRGRAANATLKDGLHGGKAVTSAIYAAASTRPAVATRPSETPSA